MYVEDNTITYNKGSHFMKHLRGATRKESTLYRPEVERFGFGLFKYHTSKEDEALCLNQSS